MFGPRNSTYAIWDTTDIHIAFIPTKSFGLDGGKCSIVCMSVTHFHGRGHTSYIDEYIARLCGVVIIG